MIKRMAYPSVFYSSFQSQDLRFKIFQRFEFTNRMNGNDTNLVKIFTIRLCLSLVGCTRVQNMG
jgi:hypothetical protein